MTLFIIAAVWLAAAVINIVHHAPWTSVAFDFVLCLAFIIIAVVRAIRSGGGPGMKGK